MDDSIIAMLIKKRNDLGLSQRELASRCGLEKSTISRIETGQTSPNLQTLKTIANKLECVIVVQDNYSKDWHHSTIEAYWEDELTATVQINDNAVSVKKYTNLPAKQFFYAYDKMDLVKFSELMESRCWDRNRVDIMQLLRKLGMEEYDPVEIVRRTHGVSYNDSIWFKFGKDNISWDKISPKR